MKTLNTVSFSGDALLGMKKENKIPKEALDALRERAEEHLRGEVFTVTKRFARAKTGDAHDYCSYGPYWWPNPDTPDGLPYVRRDGEIRPGTLEEITPRLMARRVLELTLAAFYLDSDEYGKAAADAICAWHLDPETYMKPNAEYAQAIPGICDGRGIGIIDFAYSYQIFDSAEILNYLGYFSDEKLLELKKWYSDFADWLLTSENALTEDTEPNNHGTFFDLLVLSIAEFVGREALAKKICETSYKRRFKAQIESDGKQPLELSRTMAFHYSLCNLRGLIGIANIASKRGYNEFFEPDPESGVCLLKAAIDFMYPYMLDRASFPYAESFSDDVFPSIPNFSDLVLYAASEHFPEYEEKRRAIPNVTDHLLRPRG